MYLRDGPAQTVVRAATLRQKQQSRLAVSPSHGALTLGQPGLVQVLESQRPGKAARRRTVQVTGIISRVPDQNGVSQAWYIVEIHHSGRKPSIYPVEAGDDPWFCCSCGRRLTPPPPPPFTPHPRRLKGRDPVLIHSASARTSSSALLAISLGPGRAARRLALFRWLVWLDRVKQGTIPGSAALTADALPLGPQRD